MGRFAGNQVAKVGLKSESKRQGRRGGGTEVLECGFHGRMLSVQAQLGCSAENRRSLKKRAGRVARRPQHCLGKGRGAGSSQTWREV